MSTRRRLIRVAKIDRLFDIESYLLRAKLGNMIHWKSWKHKMRRYK